MCVFLSCFFVFITFESSHKNVHKVIAIHCKVIVKFLKYRKVIISTHPQIDNLKKDKLDVRHCTADY